jgi:hypothetical protein
VSSPSGSNWSAMRGQPLSGTDMARRSTGGHRRRPPATKRRVLVSGSTHVGAAIDVATRYRVTSRHRHRSASSAVSARQDRHRDPQHQDLGAPLCDVFRDVDNLRLGRSASASPPGLGVRIISHGRSDRSQVRNIQIDYVYRDQAQGVETCSVDDITIGTVVARDVGERPLLNDTTNAEVGLVDSINSSAGTATPLPHRNRNGRINNAYPTNIHVGQVIARTGGRGIFCVSESGGLVIDRVDIANTGNNAILLENCYNVNIAAVSGTVNGGGEIRIAARTEFANTSDIRFQNLTLTSNRITESPCATNSTYSNITPSSAAHTNCN